MSSAAASAASAAFKGGTQPVQSNPTSKGKPQLKIKLDANGNRIGNDSKSAALQTVRGKLTPSLLVPLVSPAYDIKSSRDDQGPVISDHEYFNSLNDLSTSSHDTGNLEMLSRSKVSVNTRPQEMLKLVRASIQSKSKTGLGRDAGKMGHQAINEFRNALELRKHRFKRNVSPHPEVNIPFVTPNDRVNDSNLMVASAAIAASATGSTEHVPERVEVAARLIRNESRSSFSSLESESIEKPLVATVRASVSTSGSDENLTWKKVPSSLTTSPIQAPPSPNALSRGVTAESENVPYLSILPSCYLNSSSDVVDHLEPNLRLGRKPPPALCESNDTNRKGSWSASEVSLNSDQDDIARNSSNAVNEDIKNLRLNSHLSHLKIDQEKLGRDPQQYDFPGLSKNNLSIQTEIDHEENDQSQLASVMVGTVQPVKLKTTLRKMSKKKEKRTLFNEDKPWKNHCDLDAISENQRKRYEGLWVSNKGSYVNKTIARLVGVNYDREESKANEQVDKKEMSEKEISRWAAKLSTKAKYRVEVDENDIRSLHGLDEAETQELIHGIVVKRIWERSKLLDETLASIWDLVDYRRDGTLNKAEFLVGMWLVDQCLYGRKLPKTVGNTVWNSVGSIGLNRVMKKKRR